MAKRRRLSPATEAGRPAPETKQAPGGPLPSPAPSGAHTAAGAPGAPIARVTGEAAAVSALEDVSRELDSARREGRLVQRLPLDAVAADYLMRDRMEAGEEELAALMESLRARGQQTPVEVADLGAGRYGLISGWRRLTALARLRDETGEARFGEVLALIRVQGAGAEEAGADAYLAMVEENEVRVGLSYYERARIVARTVAEGVFADPRTALGTLFASASRAKRSKIGAFLPVYRELDGVLAFPVALAERQGLELSRALADPAFGPRLRQALKRAAPADAAAEQALLAKALETGAVSPPPEPTPPPAERRAPPVRPRGEELAPGIFLERRDEGVTLSGPGCDAAFRARLRGWLTSG